MGIITTYMQTLQEYGIKKKIKDLVQVQSIMGYMITYAKCPIIWVSWIQTEILLITMEAE